MERDEVAPRQQLLERQIRGPQRLSHGIRQRLEVVVQDLHTETLRPARDGLADPAEPDDADRRTMRTSGPSNSSGSRVFHFASRTKREPSGTRLAAAINKANAEVGGRLGQHARRIPHADAPPRARGDIDVVEADRIVAHNPKLVTCGIEEFVVYAIGQQGQCAIDSPRRVAVARPVAAAASRPKGPCRLPNGRGPTPPPGSAARRRPGAAQPRPRPATNRSIRSRASVRFSREFA